MKRRFTGYGFTVNQLMARSMKEKEIQDLVSLAINRFCRRWIEEERLES
jgi:hypothetical protein